MVPIGLVYSIHDPTDVAINKMIEASQNDQDDQSRRRKARRSEPSSKEALRIRKNAI